MPAWNAQSWITDSIQSVKAQTWTDWELIVIDDGSSDGTLATASRFDDPRIRVIHQENAGASAARNRAFTESRGQWIQYLDADDLLSPTKLSAQIDECRLHAETRLCSGSWSRFVEDPTRRFETPDRLWADLDSADFIRICLSDNAMMHPAAWLLHRSLIDSAGGWNENISVNDDGEFFARIIARAGSVRFVQDAHSLYRSNLVGSLSGRSGEKSARSQMLALDLIAEELLRLDASEESLRAIRKAMSRLAIGLWPDHPFVADHVSEWMTPEAIAGVSAERPKIFRILKSFLGWQNARRIERHVENFRHGLGHGAIPASWRRKFGNVG